MNYYKVTEKGLVTYMPDVIVNKFDAIKGCDKDTILTGSVKPNTKVLVKLNGNSFVGVTDNKGDFSILVNDGKGFNEKSIVSVTMDCNRKRFDG